MYVESHGIGPFVCWLASPSVHGVRVVAWFRISFLSVAEWYSVVFHTTFCVSIHLSLVTRVVSTFAGNALRTGTGEARLSRQLRVTTHDYQIKKKKKTKVFLITKVDTLFREDLENMDKQRRA